MSTKVRNGLDVKRLTMNTIFGIIAFVLNLFISLFITPYITENFGSEAYGFIKLATEFASYATLLTVALNSMASRFIMLKREVGDLENARKYYSSITVANIILSAFLAVVFFVIVVYLEIIIEIPINMISEVKLVFALTFINLLVNLVFSCWGNCYYLTNRLDLNSIVTAGSYIVKVASILLLFYLFTPQISYVVWGTLLSSIFLVVCNVKYTGKLTPDLKFNIKDFEVGKIKEVLATGIWNSITRLSQIFSSGVDLLITNKFIGAIEMGYLSIAKTIPNLIITFNTTIGNGFSSNLMQLYAVGDKEGLKKATQTAMRVICLYVAIPNAILITMGTEVYRLWVPGQPAELINILSILTVINSCVTGPLEPLYQIFTITNKVKQSSIIMIIYGIVSILVTYIFLVTTDWGLFAVVGVRLIGSFIVAFCYHIPFAAIHIELPWYTFYKEIGKSILSLGISCAVGFGVNACYNFGQSWFTWILGAMIIGVICLCINAVIILNSSERAMVYEKIMSKIRRTNG